jgi:hypothetical protein
MGSYFEKNMSLNIQSIVSAVDPTRTNYFNKDQLTKFMQNGFMLNYQDAEVNMSNLDPYNSGHIKIQELLNQVNANVMAPMRKGDMLPIIN